MDLAIAGKRLN